MSDTLIATIITSCATALVSVIALLVQRSTSQAAMQAQRSGDLARIHSEEESRNREKRRDQLIDALTDMLAVSDPQISITMDYGRAVALIHRIQLRLDPQISEEANLAISLTNLGNELQFYIPVHGRSIQDKMQEIKRLLSAQAAVLECSRALLRMTASQDQPNSQ